MIENLTFDQLPKAVTILTNEISDLKRLLLEKVEPQPTEQLEQFLNIQEAAKLLHLTVPTIYSKHSKGELPNVCKRGKRLYFSRQSLIEYIKKGRKKSYAEIEQEAEAYLSNKKGLK